MLKAGNICNGSRKTGKGDRRFPVNLYCSLMLMSFIPFLYTIVRTNLIAGGPSADGLSIAGHMEWFDLINETIQAFLIVPLFALLNQCAEDKHKWKERIFQTFLIVNVIYILFSLFVLGYCGRMVSEMASGQGSDRLPQAGDDRVYCGKCSQLRKCIVCRAGKAMLHLYDGLFENNSYHHWRFIFHSCVWGERRRHFFDGRRKVESMEEESF